MAHDVGHGGHFGVAGEFVAFVDVEQKFIAEREVVARDVSLGPDLDLEVGVEFPVHLDDLALGLGHFPLDPDQVEYLGNDIRFVPPGVGLNLISGIIDGEISHALPVLQQVVQTVAHGVDVVFEIVHRDLSAVDFLPLPRPYHHFFHQVDAVRHVKQLVAGFYQPLGALAMRDLRLVVLLGQI